MKNKFLHSIGMLALLIAAGACTDFEMKSDGRDTLNSIFSNYGKARGYYQNIVSSVPQIGSPNYYGTQLSSFSDEAQDVTDNSSTMVAYWYAGTVNAISNPITTVFDPWSNYFITIRRCNTFLQAMGDPEMVTFAINDTEKNSWMAQVRVIRAFAYLQLMKRYGVVPVMDVPNEIDYDYSKSVRNTVEEVTDFILADCDAALAIPEAEGQPTAFRWNLTDNDRGVISRAFAQAIKSETALYAASPLFYKSGSKYTWAKAAEITKAALDACLDHGFELYDRAVEAAVAQNPYAYYFIQRSDPSRQLDKETIYESFYQLSIWKEHGTPVWPGTTSAGTCPSQELVDAYETIDGEPVLDLDQPYLDADHLVPNYNAASIYDPDDPYANRDPRFYASIYYNGAPRTLAGEAKESIPLAFGLPTDGVEVTEGENGELTIRNIDGNTGEDRIRTPEFPIPIGYKVEFVFEYKSNMDVVNNLNLYADLYLQFDLPKADYWEEFRVDILENGGFYNLGDGTTDLIMYPNSGVSGYEIILRNVRLEAYQLPATPVTVETFTDGNCEMRTDNVRYTRTGYYLRKYNNHRSNVDVASDGYMKLYRLGELYLNFAEAAYNAGGPDVAVSGMSAREAVNKIRERAGMPELPAGMSKDAFEKRYRNERRIEMAFEEQRFFDVRRWKILSATDGFVTAMKITKSEDENFTYERVKLNRRNCSDEKFLLFPIDWTEVAKMNALTGEEWQNPGWQ